MDFNKETLVDTFLVEALQNPRHRLTILRMELDIQRFLSNVDQQQFEFQHFPTSYLRLAAHRVAQHYGMETTVQDSAVEGMGSKILVRKTLKSKYPAVCLSEIPAKQSDNDKLGHMKIAIKPRPNKSSSDDGNGRGTKSSHVRSVEERKEEYDKARARIFSNPGSPESGDVTSQDSPDKKSESLNRDDIRCSRLPGIEIDNSGSIRDGFTPSRVAILRDIEKDRTDPDYDRSYKRYIRNQPPPIQSFSPYPFNVHNAQLPFVQYDATLPQLGLIPRSQASVSNRLPSNPVLDPFCAAGSMQMSRDAAYMQWQSAMMMHAHSYEPLRRGVFQPAYRQQPLSFGYSQNQ